MLSLLTVGLAPNIWICLLGRVVGGLLNGNGGVIQTMVGEIVTDPAHEPRAYAIMPFVWSIGTILGPSIGGYFAEPASNFPNQFPADGIFGRFPYLLPNLICSGLMLLSIVCGWLFIGETHHARQSSSNEVSSHAPQVPTQATSNMSAADLTHESYGTFNAIEEQPGDEAWDLKPDGTSRSSSISGAKQKVFSKRVVMLVVALGIFTYHSMTYDHLLPIFLQDERVPVEGQHMMDTDCRAGSLSGGLGLDIHAVGVILSIQGLIALFVQAVVFPIMASWLGVWKSFMVVTTGHPIAYAIVPFLSLLAPRLVYPALFACLTVRNILSIVAYPVLLILIKEASPGPSSLGKINGFAASTGAACRTLASPIAGYLYGVGIQIDFTPIAWWASALVAVIGAIQVFFIHRRMTGPQHEVHAAEPIAHFLPGRRESEVSRRSSVVHIRIAHDEQDERTSLLPARSGNV